MFRALPIMFRALPIMFRALPIMFRALPIMFRALPIMFRDRRTSKSKHKRRTETSLEWRAVSI